MELDPQQLRTLDALLRTKPFRDEITEVLAKPFWDPSKDKPDEWNSSAEAGRKRWIDHPLFWLVETFALITFGIAAWGQSWLKGVVPLPPTITLYPMAFVIGAGLLCLFVPVLFWWYKIPVHDPDPLFGRLLQAKSRAESPHPRGLIADLLEDRRFYDLVQRALDQNLPAQNWDATVGRLVDAVKDDDTFAQLYTNQQSSEPNPHDAIGRYLKYVARRLVFETVLDDPDFRYLYDDISQRRQTIAKWLAKIRWDKAKDLLEKPSERPSSKGPEVLTAANVIVLIVLLVVTILKKGTEVAPPKPDPSMCEECAHEIEKIETIVIPRVLAAIAEQKSPPPAVHVSVQPGFQQKPSPNQIEVNIPPSIEFTLKSDAHPTVDVNVKEQQPECCKTNPSPPKRRLRSDAYLRFTKMASPTPSEKSATAKAASPSSESCNSENSPPEGDCTTPALDYAQIDKKENRVLDQGVICSYSARLVSSISSRWPPDPVEIKVSSLSRDTNTDYDSCPQINSPVTIYAGRTPMYSAVFGANFGIEEERTKSRFIPQKIHPSEDLLIIRIRPQDSP